MRSLFSECALLVLLALILLSIFPILRFSSSELGSPPFNEGYYHHRLASHLVRDGLAFQDDAVLAGRPYLVNPYHLLLVFVPLPWEIAVWFVPIVLGMVALVLLVLLTYALKISLRDRWIFFLVFVLSSPFLLLFQLSTPASLLLVIVLLIMLLHVHATRGARFVAFLLILLLPFFGIFAFLFSFALLFSFFSFQKVKVESRVLFLLPSLILMIILQFAFFTTAYPRIPQFLLGGRLIPYTSDFGGLYGLGIFHWILFGIGIVVSWRWKRELLPVYAFIVVALIFGVSSPELMKLLFVVAACFASYAFIRLLDQSWDLEFLKQVTLMVLVCGLLFSLVSFVNQYHDAPPHDSVMLSMNWLARNTKNNAVVLAPYSRGDWITFLGNRTVLIDGEFAYAPELDLRENVTKTIYASRALPDVRKMLTNFSVNYIYIDGPMRSGEVWRAKDEGLLFLLRDNETFKKSYSNGDVEIWQVLQIHNR